MGWSFQDSVRDLYNTCSSTCNQSYLQGGGLFVHVTCVVIKVYIVIYGCGAEHLCVYGGVLFPSLLLYLF